MTNTFYGTIITCLAPGIISSEMLTILESLNGKLKTREEKYFLDLTITINDSGKIKTRTCQKPMNLYLYIPAASAHPLGVGKAMVYGSLRCYCLQNTHSKDYLKQIKLLFVRMKARA